MGHLTRLSTDYWRFWAATAVSNLGDGIRFVALPLLAVTLTRDPLLISGISALTFLPWLVVGPFSGAIVDRVDRRRLIVSVQVGRGTVAAVFAVVVATGEATIWWLYLTALVIAVGETLADSAAQAAVPHLVANDQLEVANGRIVSAQIVANEVAGGPIGGWLFALAAAVPFALDATTYLAAAVLVVLVRVDLSPTPDDHAEDRPRRLLAEVAEGFRYTFRHRVLRGIAVSAALANFGSAAGFAVLVLLAVDELGVSSFGFGVLLGVGALGGIVGANLARRIVDLLGRGRALALEMLACAGGVVVVGRAGHVVVVAVALFVLTLVTAAYNVVTQSLRQTLPPPRLLGRVITSVRFLGLGMAPVGALVGGAVARIAGVRSPFLVAGVAFVLATVVLRRDVNDETIGAALAGVPLPGTGRGDVPPVGRPETSE